MNRHCTVLGMLGMFAGTRELRARPAASPDLLRIRASDRAMGQAEAPIVIVEYASFTCAACARFHREGLPAVKRRWIDSGKAKLVFRQFPFDNVATRMSQLAECSTPANFFQTVETLFRTQNRWVRSANPVAEAVRLLAGLGVTRQAAG